MAELEESIYSYSGTSNKKCFLDAQTFIILITLRWQLWLVHVVTTPFVQQRRAQKKAREASRQHTAKRKARLPPQKPIKKSVSITVTFAVFPLYKVSDAGGCLAESVLQE